MGLCVKRLRKTTCGPKDSNIEYKARLLAHEYRQIYGSDYWERMLLYQVLLRTILVFAANNNMLIHQIDIDTAFLNKRRCR
jgi:hypothetical protein